MTKYKYRLRAGPHWQSGALACARARGLSLFQVTARKSIHDRSYIREFFFQGVARARLALAMAPAIHCADCESRREHWQQRLPAPAVTGAAMNNQEVWPTACALDGDARAIRRSNE